MIALRRNGDFLHPQARRPPMELSDQDRRLMAGTRDRILMEQIEVAEAAVTREQAVHGSYMEVIDRLAIMTVRYEECRKAFWSAAIMAGLGWLGMVALVLLLWPR